MSNGATGVHQHPPSNLPIPTDRVLGSGAVTFPGAFDQHGCPLVMFPLGEQHKLGLDLGKEEVAQFIAYFLRLHNKYQEKESLVSVAVDLRKANLTTARFFAETLLLLERHKRTVHTVYVVQPKKRDVQKMLLKLLLPSSSKNAVLFKRVFLKELCELCNYIDRSQLTPEMGGYLVYCHQSWMTFLKEIDAFVQEFVAVVQRLPSCIATLQTLSWQPVPNSFEELRKFCSSNEAQFHELRRELGLDRLLRHCEIVLEKLHCPENEPSYQAMAGTTFFTHTTYDMLQNYSRIMAAVEKVELLWQQAFSKAHLQLQVMKLQKEAQQMMDLMNKMTLAKLQPYRIEIARDVRTAEKLKMEYEMSIYKPGMAVVHQADDLIRTLTKMGVCGGPNAQAEWIQALESRKEKFHSSLELPHHTLRAISDFYYCYTKSKNWYSVVLRETFLQDLLWSGSNNSPRLSYFLEGPDSGSSAWKQSVWAFLRRNPSPEMEELVQLAHLSNVVPDGQLQQTGKQLSHRCMILRKLLMSPGAVPLHELQLALQWQYEFLRDNQNDPVESVKSNKPFAKNICQERTHGLLGQVNSSNVPSKHRVMDTGALSKCMTGISVKECDPKLTERVQESTSAKPPSLSSFDSGFGPGSAHLDNAADKETCVSKEASRPVKQPQVQENISRVSDSEDVDMVGCNSRPSIQIIPKIAVDSLNFEIKVKRSATLPKNPWLSLPVDDLESSYTVTITPSMASADRSLLKTPTVDVSKFKNQRVQTGTPISNLTLSAKQQKSLCGAGELKSSVSILQPQDCFEDSDLSPIRHVLSSTITDGREKSNCTTESVPTLLWDSYDLHNAKQDSCDGLVKSLTEISLNNWELKEQEGLREVEDMLDRAAGILQEEESVLAQEGLLDVLLRTENTNQHWTLWGDDQPSLTTMSSKELMEAGVDFDDTTLLSHTTQDKSNTFSFAVTDTLPTDSLVALQSESCNLLQELRDLDILEEQITEENLKIQELRQSECVESLTELQKVHSVNKKREQFLKELKKEKLEVERMERSLNKEMAKGNSRKKKISETCKVVKCSVMERTTSLKDEETKSMCQSQSHIEDISHKNIVINGDTPECTTSLVQVGEGKNTNALGGRVLCDVSPDSNLVSSSAGLISYDPACVENSELIRKSFVDVHETLDGVMDVPLTPSFDPGGEGVGPPVPKPRKMTLFTKPDPDLALPLEELQVKTEPSVRLGPLPKARDRSTKPPSLSSEHEEHANNNNNKQKPPETKPTQSESHFSPATKPEVPQVSNQEAPCRHPAEEMEQPLEEHVEESGCHRVADKLYPSQLCSTVTLADMSEFGVPIVLDTGSGLMKAGFADQELPTTIFPTVIGFPKYEEIMNGSSERELYIGHEAQHMRGVLTLRHPMKHGIIRNWHEMEKIWHHTFQQLRVDPEEHPVMLTEAALNPRENRERVVELMFEEFSVPFTYVAMQAVLALYAAGRTTGVVFDSGDGVSHSVPVFEGYCLTHAVQRFPLAGMDVTLQLRKLLQEQGVTLRTTAELEIVREMKERCCTVAQDYEAELAQGGAASSEMFYTMPDGHVVRLTTERFRAPEILFKPELIGRDLYGMHESVFKSVLQSDLDLRRSFISNIILSGGNTLLQGLPQRLQKEVSSLVPAELVRCVRVSSPEDRDFSVWSGGAALASLPSFASTWISRNEYDEFGPQIVFRKCF